MVETMKRNGGEDLVKEPATHDAKPAFIKKEAGAPPVTTGGPDAHHPQEAEDPDLDPELEAMKQRLSEMEQEAARFREMQAQDDYP